MTRAELFYMFIGDTGPYRGPIHGAGGQAPAHYMITNCDDSALGRPITALPPYIYKVVRTDADPTPLAIATTRSSSPFTSDGDLIPPLPPAISSSDQDSQDD
ncbi:hypothetical protein NL676_003899 [Syzygium grande]|nr:hypothetical protein NL676_003899 [Syzygium grande]